MTINWWCLAILISVVSFAVSLTCIVITERARANIKARKIEIDNLIDQLHK